VNRVRKKPTNSSQKETELQEAQNSQKPAEEMKTQHDYPKLQANLTDEIRYFLKEIKAEIDWLDRYCENEIGKCKSTEDLSNLSLLKEYLRIIKQDMRRNSYVFLGCERLIWTLKNPQKPTISQITSIR
jgi:hypothetical protein